VADDLIADEQLATFLRAATARPAADTTVAGVPVRIYQPVPGPSSWGGIVAAGVTPTLVR
jgi:hypothetical protein